MKKLKSGILVAFEGIDGAGKSTQAKDCYEFLSEQGFSCLLLREPTDGPIGKKIRSLAQSGRDNITPFEEFTLFIEDRKEDVLLNINPALAQNKIILIDRYYYSSIAYQGALGLDPNFIKTENEKIAPRPQRVYYISISTELTDKRITRLRGDSIDLFEKKEYLKKVKSIFDSMDYPEIFKIDGSLNKDEIKNLIIQDIYKIISPLLVN